MKQSVYVRKTVEKKLFRKCCMRTVLLFIINMIMCVVCYRAEFQSTASTTLYFCMHKIKSG